MVIEGHPRNARFADDLRDANIGHALGIEQTRGGLEQSFPGSLWGGFRGHDKIYIDSVSINNPPQFRKDRLSRYHNRLK